MKQVWQGEDVGFSEGKGPLILFFMKMHYHAGFELVYTAFRIF